MDLAAWTRWCERTLEASKKPASVLATGFTRCDVGVIPIRFAPVRKGCPTGMLPIRDRVDGWVPVVGGYAERVAFTRRGQIDGHRGGVGPQGRGHENPLRMRRRDGSRVYARTVPSPARALGGSDKSPAAGL